MNQRLIAVLAGIVGVLGVLLRYVDSILSGRLTTGELPEWAIYGTAGTSVLVYLYVIGLIVALATVGLAVGAGYYVGRRIDVDREYRAFIRAIAAGSTVGVSVIWAGGMWRELTTIGDAPAAIPESQATEMFVGDLATLGLSLVSAVAEIGLFLVVGMLAGAALAQFRKKNDSLAPPTTTRRNAPPASDQPADRDSSESSSQPA